MPSVADFAMFLAKRTQLEIDKLPKVGLWAGTGNTIGAIALRMSLLDLDQIDRILELQKQEGELFGQLAVRLNFLKQEQVARLVQLQQLHQQLEIGGQLVVHGQLSLVELLDALLEFHKPQDPSLESLPPSE